MANKEFTRGDVINIFGRVIGKSIEITGGGIFLLSKGLAKVARGVFWVAGKHVDTANTLINIKRRDEEKPLIEADRPNKDLRGRDEILEIMEKITPIEQALNYSQSAYEDEILPQDEVIKIDNQAIMMAKAARNFLERLEDSQLKKEGIKNAEAFLKVSSLFLKYHNTGNESFHRKAKELLKEVSEFKRKLMEK